MFGISNENLSIGDFLLKNFPDYYPLCIVSEMKYPCLMIFARTENKQ